MKTKEILIAKEKEDVYNFGGLSVVVDFFRFSTTINALLTRNKKIRVYSDEKEVIDFINKNKNWDLFSEKNLNIARFDNSPHLALKMALKDNIIVVTNSGSKALLACRKSSKIIIGSLCNISSIKKSLLNFEKEVILIPACIFFNKNHVEDFFACEFIKDYIEGKNMDLKKLRERVEKAKRIDELLKLRATAREDIEIIFSIDKFNTLPVSRIYGDFAEVVNEKSDN